MANTKYQGVYYAGLQGTIPELIEESQLAGTLVRSYDSFVLTADLASGDTILMGGLIPEGAVLVDAVFTATTGLGGSCTINIGWQASANALEAANATGFFSALPCSSAVLGTRASSSSYGSQTSFLNHTLLGAVQPVIAENAVSSGATGNKIQLEIWYMDGL